VSEAAIVALIQGLVAGLPQLISAIKQSKDIKSIKLEEFISSDALDKIQEANKRASDFVQNG
jgi:hypothetical protein